VPRSADSAAKNKQEFWGFITPIHCTKLTWFSGSLVVVNTLFEFRKDIPEVVVPCTCCQVYYRMEGNFRGDLFSWFSWFRKK
jgi:hypothetical protein